jgi:hypothetical protein
MLGVIRNRVTPFLLKNPAMEQDFGRKASSLIVNRRRQGFLPA